MSNLLEFCPIKMECISIKNEMEMPNSDQFIKSEPEFDEYKQENTDFYSISEKLDNENVFFAPKIEQESVEILTESTDLKQEFRCEKCEFITVLPWELQNHMFLNHHGSPWFWCEKCDFKTETQQLLIRHQKKLHSRTGIRRMKCYKCPKILEMRCGLKQHVIRHHPEISSWFYFNCEDCNYKTSSPNNLKNHNARMHLHNEIWYKCTKCPSESQKIDVMEDHILNRHPNKDIEKIEMKWLKCTLCSFCFTSPSVWLKHLSSNHDEALQYRCICCNYKSKEIFFLKEHVIKKHIRICSPRSFKCTKCRYRTSLSGKLRKHFLQVHSPSQGNPTIKQDTESEISKPVEDFNESFEYEQRFYKRITLSEHHKNNTIDNKCTENQHNCPHCPYRAKKNFELKLHISLIHKQ